MNLLTYFLSYITNSPKKIFLAFFLCFSFLTGLSQNQKTADSLKHIYYSDKQKANDLKLLEDIAINETKPDSSLKYSEILISHAVTDSNLTMTYRGYIQKGAALRMKGDYEKALEALFTGMEYVLRANKAVDVASLYIAIGNVYSLNENSSNADLYYKKGLEIFRKEKDSVLLGKALYNAGDEFIRTDRLEIAENYTQEAAAIFDRIGFPIGKAYCLGNLGRIFARAGNDVQAEQYLNNAINLLEDFEDFNAISVYLTYMADLYMEKGDEEKALAYAERSLDLARKHNLKDQISASNFKLSQLYEAVGDSARSYKYYKDYITFRDSVTNLESIRKMADLRTNFEVSQKQNEVDLLNQQRRYQKNIVVAAVIAVGLFMLLAVGLYRRNNFIRRTNLIIQREKNRSEHLLLNILPEETAAELKKNGKVQAKRFENVSVLFTDFESFTNYSESLSPEELVKSVDFYFSKFDKIVEKHGLEKIKTIGDSYMCAAGVPFPVPDHAERLILAAREMLDFVLEAKQQKQDRGVRFDIRLGINSGPVIAGVVGLKKFAYDIWGDTVNIASRMEACSETGKINISENTYKLIKDKYKCEYRGEIEVKNKGKMKMYFVTGILKEKSVDVV
ncbi:adenylate/guanylate cyclase domain-containing protein [Salinimicrobium sp. TH3]|uniref:adenylate/guanylate cyclase domain-containing protein n=1 Tax=Salinimicrobium sp. TH3 TaxID=2997342 RepID=UPI002274EE46|nr:adenylate/guanylate cyclase domain-containing protein [Salinimicrobium sp. TH3]MCY2687628.1 adenylate/guanylate cyclase domain-containing protein [Salinimicrobium sp. TH3]